MLAGSLLAACFDSKDFEFDKFTISDLEPTLYLPLVNDTVRLDVNNDYNVLYDEEGRGYLHFAIGNNNILPSPEAFFKVPSSVTIPVSNASINLNYSTGSSYSTSIPYSCSYSSGSFPRQGQRIDSIIFKSGTFSITIVAPANAAGSYTITIPTLRKNGEAFSAIIPFGNTSFNRDLSGYMLQFESNNAFNATIGVTILASSSVGQYSFSSISFSNVETKAVYGYFGQVRVSPAAVDMDISTFDRFRNNNTTELRIKEAFLHFRVKNGAGFPIQLNIDKVASTYSGQSAEKDNVGRVTILANPKSDQLYLSSTYTVGSEALGEVLSKMPSRVEFQFSGMINPNGDTEAGQSVRNFLIDDPQITISDIEARIPLNFSVSGMELQDTLDFNASKITFKDMELALGVENNMPVAVTLQAYLMNEQGPLPGAPVLFETPVSIPAATVDATTGEVTAPFLYNKKIKADVKHLKQTKKLKVEITVDTGQPASQFVRVTKNNYVYLKIGAEAKVNINDIE
jgi:hypothetical protein